MGRDTRSLSWDEGYLHDRRIVLNESPSMPAAQEASVTSNSSSSSSHDGKKRIVTPVLYRTNFGKNMSYIPPANGVWNGYSPQKAVNVASDDHSLMSEEPFDQQQQNAKTPLYAPDLSTQPYVPSLSNVIRSSSQNSRQSVPFDEREGVEDDMKLQYPPSMRGAAKRVDLSASIDANKAQRDIRTAVEKAAPRQYRSYHSDQDRASARYRMAPPRISDPLLVPYLPGATLPAFRDEAHELYDHSARRQHGARERKSRKESAPSAEEDDEEDDSLFDFEEERRRRKAKRWRNSRRGKYSAEDEEDDEDDEDEASLEGQHASLTERAHAAWKRKNARASKVGTPKRKTNESHNPAVSFRKNDTVHEFEPDQEETYDSCTLGGRSLNSEYTKSAESEVEDLIKDIFMIGSGKSNNPGRRKIKYSPHVKAKLREKVTDADVDEDETLETYDDDEEEEVEILKAPEPYRKPSQPRKLARQSSENVKDDSKDEEDDPMSSIWSAFEGGWMAIGNVLGLDGSEDGDSAYRGASKCGGKPACIKDDENGLGGFWQTFSDAILGQSHSSDQVVDNLGMKKAPSLEEDMRLIELAVQAARSMHKLRGFEFDDSYEINIVSDIKFCVVDLSLPLGLIFQENETGCWITKVLPHGSGHASGLIEVGDQLAAIDGVSAINMKVDEIAHAIQQKTHGIELTFLRYVGPLRPAAGTVTEEGYEVKASSRPEDLRLKSNSAAHEKRNTCKMLGSRRPTQQAPEVRKVDAKQSKKPSSTRNLTVTAKSASKKKGFRMFGRRNRSDTL